MQDEVFQHPDHHAFLIQSATEPDNALTAKVHADWLEEHDKPQLANIIREYAEKNNTSGNRGQTESRDSNYEQHLLDRIGVPHALVYQDTPIDNKNRTYTLFLDHSLPKKVRDIDKFSSNYNMINYGKKGIPEADIGKIVENLKNEGVEYMGDKSMESNLRRGIPSAYLPDTSWNLPSTETNEDPNHNKHYSKELNEVLIRFSSTI